MERQLIALGVIIAYLVLTTVIGSLMASRSGGSRQWAAGGGQIGMLMVAVGIAGTRIGGVGTYGVAADVITGGLWNLWFSINTLLALALVGLFFAVPYRRLCLHSVGEIFWLRFRSRRSQALTSLCVQSEYLIVNILEPFVIASILVGVTGMDFGLAVFIAAFVLITYTALGGLWGSVVTNLIHCLVMVTGLALVLFVGVEHLGGWGMVAERVDAGLVESGADVGAWWNLTGAGWIAVIAMFFSAVIHTPAASVYVNFASAVSDERRVVPAFILAGVIAALVPLLAGGIGVLTFANYGAEAQGGGYSMITRLAMELDPLLGGIAMAAVLAAVISSGGPILLSSATMFVTDWMPGVSTWSSARRLRAFRITTVVYGLVAATIAWQGQIGSILKLLLFGFAMVVPPAIAVGFVIYWRRTTEQGVFWGMAAGYSGGVIWYGLIRLAEALDFTISADSGAFSRLCHWLFVYRGDGIDPTYATTLIPLVAIPMISLLTVSCDTGAHFYQLLGGGQSARDAGAVSESPKQLS